MLKQSVLFQFLTEPFQCASLSSLVHHTSLQINFTVSLAFVFFPLGPGKVIDDCSFAVNDTTATYMMLYHR